MLLNLNSNFIPQTGRQRTLNMYCAVKAKVQGFGLRAGSAAKSNPKTPQYCTLYKHHASLCSLISLNPKHYCLKLEVQNLLGTKSNVLCTNGQSSVAGIS